MQTGGIIIAPGTALQPIELHNFRELSNMPSSAVPQLASKVPPWLGVGVGVGVAAQGLTLGLAWGLGLRGAWAYFSERIPPNDAGVAAALAEYADAPVDRECAADRRAGERAGYTVSVCVCVRSLPQNRGLVA